MRYAPLAVAGFIVVVFFVALFAGNPADLPSPLIGQSVPEFSMPRLLQDGTMSDADLKTGEVIVLNVWASWCVPCRAEHPHLMALKESGVRVVGINYKDSPHAARAFLAARGNPFATIGVDARGQTAFAFGVYGVPETFIIDNRDNKTQIVARFVGALDAARIQKEITPLLRQP